MIYSSSNAKDIAEQASNWLMRLNAKDMDEEERAALARWLAQSPQHRLEFDRMQALWHDLEPLRERHAVMAELQAGRAAQRGTARKRMLRVSFAGCAVAILGWFAVQALVAESGSIREIHTGRGELQSIALDDGSLIELDADSNITLQISADVYRVHLKQGNAFFTVAHGIIRDIGTRFGVSAEGTTPTVGVLDGEVEVQNSRVPFLHLGPAWRLIAGQGAALPDDGGIEPLGGHPEAQFAWRSGLLVFDRTTLAEAVQRISRYHTATITVDAQASGLQLSGAFNSGDLQAFLWGIQQIHPVSVSNRDGRIQILTRQPRPLSAD